MRTLSKGAFAAVLVAALGYFVDIYDLILFSIVRIESLKSLGLSGEDLTKQGIFLINMQMMGMFLGDKRGRLSVLFGSIFLYSIANIANAFVTDVHTYAWMRFIAGIGLAGELGAGITLVSEILPKETRGYGTMIVATVGVLGAVAAGWVAGLMSWQNAYIIGGVMGLALLVLRINVVESEIFSKALKEKPDGGLARGSFFQIFSSWHRFKKYARCILVGVPTWYVIGILVTFSPEFGRALGMEVPIRAGTSVMYCYAGLSVGDFLSGLLSQLLRSRKKVILIFLGFNIVATALYLTLNRWGSPISEGVFYACCFLLGLATGYWALFVTIASENFGTNLRATVTTTVPNFVRAAVVPFTLFFEVLRAKLGSPIPAAGVVGAVALMIAFGAWIFLDETFGKDLDYWESKT